VKAFNTLMKGEVTAEKIQEQKDTFKAAEDSYQTTCDALLRQNRLQGLKVGQQGRRCRR
jgi:hypothetical protein